MKQITGIGGRKINIIRALQVSAFMYFVFVLSMPVLTTLNMVRVKGLRWTMICKSQGEFRADLDDACHIWKTMGRDIREGWLN